MNVVETNLWGLQTHVINVDGQQFTVTTFSNASISNTALNMEEKALIFNLTGFEDTIGYCNITIPKAMISCDSNSEWQVYIDESPIANFLVTDNNTHFHILHMCTKQSPSEIGWPTDNTRISKLALFNIIDYRDLHYNSFQKRQTCQKLD
jgi:hypothetical protein